MQTSQNEPIASESKNFFSYDNFLKKISSLPAVQQMVKEKTEREKSEILQSRKACLQSLKVLRMEEAAAQAKLEDSEAALHKAEAALEGLRAPVIAASNELRAAQIKRGNADRELLQIHGESKVQFALYALLNMQNNCKQQIKNLGELLKPAEWTGESWAFRYVDPAHKTNLTALQKQLTSLEKLYFEAEVLIEADLHPDEIERRCANLLTLAG